MSRENKNSRFNKQGSFWKAALNICVYTFLVTFFVGTLYSATTAANQSKESVRHDGLTLLECHVDLPHTPFHLPVKLPPIPNKSEDIDDEEQKDKFDDESSKSLWQYASYRLFNLSSEKSRSIQLEQSVQNRTTVSLIILYHSWKSFLS